MPPSVFPLAKPLERPVRAHGLYRAPCPCSPAPCALGRPRPPKAARDLHVANTTASSPSWLCYTPRPGRTGHCASRRLLLEAPSSHRFSDSTRSLARCQLSGPLLRSGQNPGLSLSPLCSLPDGTIWASDLEHSRHLGASRRPDLDLLRRLGSYAKLLYHTTAPASELVLFSCGCCKRTTSQVLKGNRCPLSQLWGLEIWVRGVPGAVCSLKDRDEPPCAFPSVLAGSHTVPASAGAFTLPPCAFLLGQQSPRWALPHCVPSTGP